jgi:hypothetical protein
MTLGWRRRLFAAGVAMLLGLGLAAWAETPIHDGCSSGASPPPTATGENLVPSFFASQVWTRYKSRYAAIEEADGTERLDVLSEQISNMDPKLAGALPGHPALAADLAALLEEHLAARRKALRKSRRREPKPDWSAELTRFVRRLKVEDGSLQGLRQAGAKDPWVEETLKHAVEQSIAVVEGRIEMVASEQPGAPLLNEARAAVQRARVGLVARP